MHLRSRGTGFKNRLYPPATSTLEMFICPFSISLNSPFGSEGTAPYLICRLIRVRYLDSTVPNPFNPAARVEKIRCSSGIEIVRLVRYSYPLPLRESQLHLRLSGSVAFETQPSNQQMNSSAKYRSRLLLGHSLPYRNVARCPRTTPSATVEHEIRASIFEI